MSFEKVKRFLSGRTFLTILSLIGVCSGIGFGVGLRQWHYPWTQRELTYLCFFGDMYIRALSGLVLPLIICSLINSVGSLDLNTSHKIATRAVVFFLSATSIASITGTTMAVFLKPGVGSSIAVGSECHHSNSSTTDTLMDLARNLFPPNLVAANTQTSNTVVRILENGEEEVKVQMIPGTNLMGLIVFSMVFGIAIAKMGETGKPLLHFFRAMGETCMMVASKFSILSPLAITLLLAGKIANQEDIWVVFTNSGWYILTALTGIFIHGLITLPLTYLLITQKSPPLFYKNMFEAFATAFGTASSTATIPTTMRCLEEKNKISTRITGVVIPIGATANMNGTSLFMPVAAVYISQLCGQELTFGQLVTICLVATSTSVGAAGIPQYGIIIIMTVLNSVGLPTSYIAYIIPIDFVIDRFRTVLNVLGDAIGAGVVQHLSKAELKV